MTLKARLYGSSSDIPDQLDGIAQTMLTVLSIMIKDTNERMGDTGDPVYFASSAGNFLRIAIVVFSNTKNGFTEERWIAYIEKECGLSPEVATCFMLFSELDEDRSSSEWRHSLPKKFRIDFSCLSEFTACLTCEVEARLLKMLVLSAISTMRDAVACQRPCNTK